MNLVERVTHRRPSPPLTNAERLGLWAGKYYARPLSERLGLDNLDPENDDVTDSEAPL